MVFLRKNISKIIHILLGIKKTVLLSLTRNIFLSIPSPENSRQQFCRPIAQSLSLAYKNPTTSIIILHFLLRDQNKPPIF